MSRLFFIVSVVLALGHNQAAWSQVLFTDDFSDGVADGWTQFPLPQTGGGVYDGGTFDASSGEYEVSDTIVSALLSTADGTEFTDGVLTFEMKNLSDAMAGGMVFRWNSEGDGYLAELIRGPSGNDAAIARFDDGHASFTPVALLADIGWTANETYQWSVTLNGPEMSFTVRELSSGNEWSGTGVDATYQTGSIGGFASVSPFDVQAPYGMRLDNITFTVPEPSGAVMFASAACLMLVKRTQSGRRKARRPSGSRS